MSKKTKITIACVGLVVALAVTAGVALAFTQSNFISFTLEGCRNDGSIILPIGGKFVCPDAAYTTGNLSKGWNELDLVPHRLTTSAGNQGGVTTTYNVYIAADYQTGGNVGYDVISVPVVNTAKSDTSCTVTAGPQSTQGSISSPFGGGTDIVVYRELTITQKPGTTCVLDYYQRLALGAHLYPGSSLQSYMFDQAGLSGGKKTLSIPVNEIKPQSLSKDMTATQGTDHVWDITKGATPATLSFGNTCDSTQDDFQSVSIKVTWTKGPADPSGPITVITHVYATNPSARVINTSVTDNIYAGTTLLGTATATKDVPANTANYLMLTHTFLAPYDATDLNDVATGTYTDVVTGVPIPGTTEAKASADVQLTGPELNASATINDSESITGAGLQFSTDSSSGASGAFDNGYVAGTKTVGPVSWTSDKQTGDASVTFAKTVYVGGPSQVSGTLSDTATLTGSDGASTSAAAEVTISTDARVSLTINKTVAPALATGSQAFTFHVLNSSSVEVATPTITFNAGDTSLSTTVSGLAPGAYTVTEDAVTDWTTEGSKTVTIDLPSCTGSVDFKNVHVFSPTISTTPNPATATVGDTINDSATLSGGYIPTGNIVFSLYGPSDTTCAGPAVYTQTVAVSGGGATTSPGFQTNAAGTYHWTAAYSGDTYNNAAYSKCADEPVVVGKATPKLSTKALVSVIVGQDIYDVATLAGGFSPTGTITFDVFAPGDDTCTTPINVPPAQTVSGAGNYTSGTYTTTAAGDYLWRAHYSGDANNVPLDTACNEDGETSTVSKASPTVSTLASPSDAIVVGTPTAISDTATISNGYNPTGAVTFTLYSDAACKNAVMGISGSGNISGGSASFSTEWTPQAVGTYTWGVSYLGDGNNNGFTACGGENEQLTVIAASPTVTTVADPTSGTVGVTLTVGDTASLDGGFNASGTVTFTLFSDDKCLQPTSVTGTVGVQNDTAAYSQGWTPPAVGTYYWTALYSGDANNNAFETGCGDLNEKIEISKATPTLTTRASGPVIVGEAIHDVATFGGGFNPTGSITFDVFAPGDSTCSNPISVPPAAAVMGAGNYSSGDYTTSAVGKYLWIAHYSGDASNNAVNTACNDPNESSTVDKASPSITTQASPTSNIVVGTPTLVGDTATLTNGYNPSGSVSFTLYSDATCTNAVAGVSGNGGISGNTANFSTSWTPQAVGTYYWIASYPGDANNNGFTTTCGDPNEQLTVIQATPNFTTQASPTTDIVIGTPTQVGDIATFDGGFNPSGTVTFGLYYDAGCSTPAGVGGTVPVIDGVASFTGSWTPSMVNLYTWQASYSGDANNSAFTTCGGANEQLNVIQASPSITTQASPTSNVVVGSTVSAGDEATLTNGYNPTGDVTFTLYSDNACTVPAGLSGAGTIDSGVASYSGSWTPTAPGTYYWIASYPGDVNNVGFTTKCGDLNEQLTVIKASPSITTQASPTTDIVVGTATLVGDTAKLTNGYTPTGNVTFTLYSDDQCKVTTGVGGAGTISGDAASFSTTWTPTAPGTYYWIASYPGDANNNAFMTGCGDANEQLMVIKASPSITTQASPTTNIVVGSTVSVGDTATLTNGYNPTGNVTFTLYSDNACTVTTGVSGSGSISGDTASFSTSWTPQAVGTYYWIASYPGDDNNDGFTTKCGDANEQLTVIKASPKFTTQADPTTGTVGEAITVGDTATFSGGFNPSGSVTFTLYSDKACTMAAGASGSGTISSGIASFSTSWTPTTALTYYWIATYAGDANNKGFETACGDLNESIVIGKAQPAISTTATDATGASTTISDSATLSGGYNPTGSITFTLYGPSDTASCTNVVFKFAPVTVNGNGTYGPVSYSPKTPGSYYWVASYIGDVNNEAVTGTCGDDGETSTIKPGSAEVIKTVSGAAPSGTQYFTFQLRQGASTTSDGTTLEQIDANATNGGLIDFTTQLIPGQHYQLCEWVMPGWNTSLGPNLFVPNSIIPPTLPNPNVNNMTVCTDFVAEAGQTATFTVDNTPPPGGRALTIGFWKNWASCSNSNGKGQKPILDQTLAIATSMTTTPPGGLVVSAQNPGGGWPNFAATYYLVLKGSTATPDVAPGCLKAVNLLNKSTATAGKKMASDPLFNMAAQLVGAQLNYFAGAGKNGPTTINIQSAILLLGKYQFNGDTYKGKLSRADMLTANCLAAQLDNYNNDRTVNTCP